MLQKTFKPRTPLSVTGRGETQMNDDNL